ncbi:hypothetical protein HOK51_08620 [Candidatus Woesearchaeota archaeon]|jgi:hypothetical protein|nr:hypothetical protein [Candidatus Woesearchaeota archaeon]MBT6519890.1 hypothetical protein [Candidatus Woesearchaeota archaeon]
MGALRETLDFIGEHPFLTIIGLCVIGGTIEQTVKYASSSDDPEIQHEQSVGDKVDDTFIEFDGTKYYSKIDGVSVEDKCVCKPQDYQKKPDYEL